MQDPEQASGFLVFAPVYARGADRHTLEGRRAGLTGWVYAAARARDVIGSLAAPVAPELELEVYDGISPRPEALLYDSARPARAGAGPDALSRVRAVTVAGRPWTLRVTALPPFDAGQPAWEPSVILAGGGLGTLLIFGFVWSLADARRGAIERAERMTGALRASEQHVRSVMDTVADAIITFGRDSRVQSANPAAEWLFGRRLADLIGRDIGDLIPGLLPAPSGQIEAEARRADDSTVPVDVAVTPAAGGDSFVASVRDVSERRAAEQALRQSEQRTRSILDNMLGGLITIDADARIESANPAAGKIFGYEPAELVGRSVAMLVPESVGDRAAYLRTAFARAIGRITEWRGQRKNGEEFPFELSMFEFTGGGAGRHFAGSVRDVSERHAVEKLKGEFISTVSHELRTPLASIRGSLEPARGRRAGRPLGRGAGDGGHRGAELRAAHRASSTTSWTWSGWSRAASTWRWARSRWRTSSSARAKPCTPSAPSGRSRWRRTPRRSPSRATRTASSRCWSTSSPTPSSSRPRGRPCASPCARATGACGSRSASTAAAASRRRTGPPSSSASARSSPATPATRAAPGSASPSARPSSSSTAERSAWRARSARGARSGSRSRSAPAADRFLEMFRVADGQPDVLLADHDVALLGVLVRQLVGDGVRVRVAYDAAEAEQAIRESAPRLLVVDLGLPEGEGRRLLDHLRTEERLSLVPLLVYSAQDVDERLQRRLALGPTRFLTKSRATDVEVRTVVSEMLGAEAREAQP